MTLKKCMCKKIVIRGPLDGLSFDRSLNYSHEELKPSDELVEGDIVILSSSNLFRLVEDIVVSRRLNPVCRIVVFPLPFQENLIVSLFPFVEFVKSPKVTLEEIYSERGTYRHDTVIRRLSEREKKILTPLSYGMSDKETAEVLGVSRRTVVRTKQRVIEKKGLVSTGQLSVFSALLKWIGEEETSVRKREKGVESEHERKREGDFQRTRQSHPFRGVFPPLP